MSELDRTKVTFEQAEGVEPLPTQLKPKELTQALRAGLWAVLHEHLERAKQHHDYAKSTLRDPWRQILLDMHVWRLHLPADEFTASAQHNIDALKKVIMRGSYIEVFGLLEWLLRRQLCPRRLSEQIRAVLKVCRAGYRLTPDGKTIMPIASEEEAAVAARAFSALNTAKYGAARQHLVAAAEGLTAGDSAGAVRESIHAVESVARLITGQNSMKDALRVLESRWKIHPALKDAFSKLYGYTSDEQGIRHPLIDDPNASVDEWDALFMFGACAAFITYLVQKADLTSKPTS
jgi:hypothetical protein